MPYKRSETLPRFFVRTDELTSIILAHVVKSILKLQEVLRGRGKLLDGYELVLGSGLDRCEEFAS